MHIRNPFPPMRAWLEQPHGRRHKAPPQPCALTTGPPPEERKLPPQSGSGLNQRDRATRGFFECQTHRKPTKPGAWGFRHASYELWVLRSWFGVVRGGQYSASVLVSRGTFSNAPPHAKPGTPSNLYSSMRPSTILLRHPAASDICFAHTFRAAFSAVDRTCRSRDLRSTSGHG